MDATATRDVIGLAEEGAADPALSGTKGRFGYQRGVMVGSRSQLGRPA